MSSRARSAYGVGRWYYIETDAQRYRGAERLHQPMQTHGQFASAQPYPEDLRVIIGRATIREAIEVPPPETKGGAL